MAAGIIDHETGTRDIRRLSGLWRFMPITATLAMVAAAAMAGVPLLNGFLSKEMFFAETIETHDGSMLDRRAALYRHAGQHVQRRLFAALHPRRLLRPASDRTCRARRTSRRRWMRFPVEVLVVAASSSASFPAVTVGPFLDAAVRCRARAQARPNTAWPSGTASPSPLLMSVVALAGGDRSICCCATICAAVRGAAACCAGLDAGAIFERVLVTVVVALGQMRWRAFSAHGVCSRNCGCWSALRCVAALWPVYDRADGLRRAPDHIQRLDLAFALGLGRRRRLRARRRLAGQVSPARGADPARRRRACHLHHLRLALRARSRPDPARGRDRDDGAAPARLALASQAARGNRRCRHSRRWIARRRRRLRDLTIAVAARRAACRCSPMRS